MPPGERLCRFHPMWPPGLLCELLGAKRKMSGVSGEGERESSLLFVIMWWCFAIIFGIQHSLIGKWLEIEELLR